MGLGKISTVYYSGIWTNGHKNSPHNTDNGRHGLSILCLRYEKKSLHIHILWDVLYKPQLVHTLELSLTGHRHARGLQCWLFICERGEFRVGNLADKGWPHLPVAHQWHGGHHRQRHPLRIWQVVSIRIHIYMYFHVYMYHVCVCECGYHVG